MPIANYSTTVTAMKSIGEIQGILVAHGAKAIIMNYSDKGEPVGLSFLIKTQFGDMPFKLPANIESVQKVLDQQRVRASVTREQAIRMAWRILKDWVRAQMAILETEMVTIDQIFLPYLETKNGKTLYQVMVNNRLALPEGVK
ncbi:MAG: hypothetical protein Q8O55_11395 [Dehalococcoidales bacterium]|nr:hypothetical protein [Dehalococcoidales bacterium]